MSIVRALTLAIMACAAALVSHWAAAEDGYELWLRYHPVEEQWIGAYRAAAAQIVPGADSDTLQIGRAHV